METNKPRKATLMCHACRQPQQAHIPLCADHERMKRAGIPFALRPYIAIS